MEGLWKLMDVDKHELWGRAVLGPRIQHRLIPALAHSLRNGDGASGSTPLFFPEVRITKLSYVDSGPVVYFQLFSCFPRTLAQ